jgi:hypothetical protein
MENESEVLSGLVLGRMRDGRCRYDPQVKQELVRRCLQPGVSVAAMAMRRGVNANLLRKWISHWQSRNAMQRAVCEVAPQDSSAFLACNSQVHPMPGWRCRQGPLQRPGRAIQRRTRFTCGFNFPTPLRSILGQPKCTICLRSCKRCAACHVHAEPCQSRLPAP